MLRTPALALGTVAGLLAAATPAVAGGDPYGPRQVTVRYDDLNLSTDAGRDRLDGRLRRAVAQVCRDGSARRIDANGARCRADALRNARTEIAARTPAIRLAMGD